MKVEALWSHELDPEARAHLAPLKAAGAFRATRQVNGKQAVVLVPASAEFLSGPEDAGIYEAVQLEIRLAFEDLRDSR